MLSDPKWDAYLGEMSSDDEIDSDEEEDGGGSRTTLKHLLTLERLYSFLTILQLDTYS